MERGKKLIVGKLDQTWPERCIPRSGTAGVADLFGCMYVSTVEGGKAPILPMASVSEDRKEMDGCFNPESLNVAWD